LTGYFYRIEYHKQYHEKYQLSKNVFEKEISFLKAQNAILNKSHIEQSSKMLSESLEIHNEKLLEKLDTIFITHRHQEPPFFSDVLLKYYASAADARAISSYTAAGTNAGSAARC
jgi:hypothetical protein